MRDRHVITSHGGLAGAQAETDSDRDHHVSVGHDVPQRSSRGWKLQLVNARDSYLMPVQASADATRGVRKKLMFAMTGELTFRK